MSQGAKPQGNYHRIRFGDFTVDLLAGELRRNGSRIRLQDQPFQLLVILTQRAGEVVTREELRQHLWEADTFVDFDNSLNAAVAKIREALADSPDEPKFIETLPRRGYRFIASVTTAPATSSVAASSETVTHPIPAEALSRTRHKVWVLAGLALVIALIVAILFAVRLQQLPKITRYVQLTNDGKPKARPVSFLNILETDGSRIYFAAGSPRGWQVEEVPISHAQSVTLPLPLEGVVVNDISKDRSKLLVGAGTKGTEPNSAYWLVSLPGGPVERLGDVRARGASWSSDGKLLAYAKDHSLYIANADGTEPRMLATFDGIPFSPRWSPDGKLLRFYLYDTQTDSGGLWEIPADGSNPHALFPAWSGVSETCCGLWTSDGKYFVFQATRDGTTHIWTRREDTGFLRRRLSDPVQLTFGPTQFLGPAISADDERLFAIGVQNRGELMRYDSASRQFVVYLSGVSAEGLDFSADGGSVLYTAYPEGTLWRARSDGSERIQLTPPSLEAASPRWSPDGKKIAFMAKKSGEPWKIYLIPSDGGRPEELIHSAESQWHPNWSPKGNTLMFGNPWWSEAPAIHLVDIATRRVSTLPGSQGFYSPRWSPDGRFVASISKDLRSVEFFDFASQQWNQVAVMDSVGYLAWSRKGEYLYFDAATKDGVSIYRVSARTHSLERVTPIPPPMGLAFGLFGPWTGLDTDDSPLLMRDTSVQEIYALGWQLP